MKDKLGEKIRVKVLRLTVKKLIAIYQVTVVNMKKAKETKSVS